MTEVPASPPCDICGAEPAIGSLMQMGTWETTRFGMDCAPDYLRTIADAISGVPVEGDTPDAGPAVTTRTRTTTTSPGRRRITGPARSMW